MKSPFYIVDDFISPLDCETIINDLNNGIMLNEDGTTQKIVRSSKVVENRILPYIKNIIPDLETYFGFEYEGTSPFEIEYYPENCENESHKCSNSVYLKGEWLRKNDNDFTAILFLNDHQEKPPLDDYYETNGGRLEFPNFHFSFNPTRGRLVIFPGAPNFVHRTTSPEVGGANQIRFHIGSTKKYVYKMENFPGTYLDWF